MLGCTRIGAEMGSRGSGNEVAGRCQAINEWLLPPISFWAAVALWAELSP